MTTAHMELLVDTVFSDGVSVTEGIKITSGFLAAKSRRWPWTSLAGKHTVSEVTAARPLSYIFLVLFPDITTPYPRLRKNVDQNGMVSQKESTLGRPTVIPLSCGFLSRGYS